MRAIDADAMIDRLKRVIQNGVPSENGTHPISAETVLEVVRGLPSIQPEPQYKTNYGFMWLCPKCGLPIHSDYTRCVRCGHNREKGV